MLPVVPVAVVVGLSPHGDVGARKRVEERIRRLREVCLEGDLPREQYTERKRSLETELASLIIPDVDAAREAGRLLEESPTLWQEADLGERRKLLTAMSEAVYIDTVEERAIVALKPKPAFRVLFQIATTRAGSGVILYKENPPDQFPSPEDDSPCSWWRRGREPVSKSCFSWRSEQLQWVTPWCGEDEDAATTGQSRTSLAATASP